jgi:hypothetical protein
MPPARGASRPDAIDVLHSHSELAVAGERDLGSRVPALGEVARDQLLEAVERRGVQTERRRGGGGERESHGDLLTRTAGVS